MVQNRLKNLPRGDGPHPDRGPLAFSCQARLKVDGAGMVVEHCPKSVGAVTNLRVAPRPSPQDDLSLSRLCNFTLTPRAKKKRPPGRPGGRLCIVKPYFLVRSAFL